MIQDENGILSARSIVCVGDRTRIALAMQKAANGSKLTIGCIGGSITEGAGASSWSTNYASLTGKWWRERFTGTEICCVNAGIGATGSILGVHRVQEDLLRFKPDFVVVEYGVNDGESPADRRCFEGLIGRILLSENEPGVMLMFLTNKEGTNQQAWQAKIGAHYHLPMASFRDAVWPEIGDGRIKWEDVEADIIHPNDNGHYLVAKFITDRLAEIHAGLDAYTSLDVPNNIPEPLYGDTYRHAQILGGESIIPEAMGSWGICRQTMVLQPGWVANGGSMPLVLQVQARNIGIVYKKYNSGDMGRAEVKVDDLPPIILDGHFPAEWGGYACAEILAEDLREGLHRVEITLCRDSNPESNGREFMICGIMVS